MTSSAVPKSLLIPGLQPVWASARKHLDKHGPQRRGRVTLPRLDPASELALKSILGRATGRLDLEQLESALIDLRIGDDLSDALTRLGHPPSAEAAQRRAVRARSTAAREALRGSMASWPEPWAADWAEDLVRSGLLGGLDGNNVKALVHGVRRLLDFLDRADPQPAVRARPSDRLGRHEPPRPVESPVASRTELAASLFGSSHALDTGTKLASFVSRALRHRLGEDLEGRELWESAGIQRDRVSAPALVWAVRASGDSPLDRLLRIAAEGGLPVHVSLLAMQRHPVTVPAGTPVLVVENPRLVEAAAERRLRCGVVATNGNPATAVTALLRQLLDSGASAWYHGDFDAAGIAICRRMHQLGCKAWMMDASDYENAISLARGNRVHLEHDTRGCGPTPWDPRLEAAFEDRRLKVHEEFVLDGVLDEFSGMASTVHGSA